VHRTEPINGVDLFVRRFGDPARPMLVIVHGGPGWDHSYSPQFDNPAEWLAAIRGFLTRR
jgi:pimeloyl-ACP methyl ester carboxylesterase